MWVGGASGHGVGGDSGVWLVSRYVLGTCVGLRPMMIMTWLIDISDGSADDASYYMVFTGSLAEHSVPPPPLL